MILTSTDTDSLCSLTALANEAEAHVKRCESSTNIIIGKCVIENRSTNFALKCQDDLYQNFVCGCMGGRAETNRGYIRNVNRFLLLNIISFCILSYF